jgi:hypothetical protein
MLDLTPALMAGMQASRAMSGHPAMIDGETDFI